MIKLYSERVFGVKSENMDLNELIYKYSEDGEIKQDSDKFPEFKNDYIKLI